MNATHQGVALKGEKILQERFDTAKKMWFYYGIKKHDRDGRFVANGEYLCWVDYFYEKKVKQDFRGQYVITPG